MVGSNYEHTPTAANTSGPVRFIDHSQIYKKQMTEQQHAIHNQRFFQNQMHGGGQVDPRPSNGSKQKSRRRILQDIIAQDGTNQMVVFNEEEEESKSRYENDYS